MGTFLDEALGHFYVSLALAAFDTYLEWPWIRLCDGPFNLFGANPIEPLLRGTGESALLVDFDPRGSHPSFLEPSIAYSVGGIGGLVETHWDGMIYLEEARAMDPLFGFTPCPSLRS